MDRKNATDKKYVMRTLEKDIRFLSRIIDPITMKYKYVFCDNVKDALKAESSEVAIELISSYQSSSEDDEVLALLPVPLEIKYKLLDGE